MMLKYLIQTSIFCYSKNYGSLTHETRIKDAVNMGDLICLLATVRTLNLVTQVVSDYRNFWNVEIVSIKLLFQLQKRFLKWHQVFIKN